MEEKRRYKILLFIFAIILIAGSYLIISNYIGSTYETTEIGSNENGTVYKITAGNVYSDKTAVLILGVHPREHEIHEAVNESIYNITSNGMTGLSKKFIVYYVVVNEDITSRAETRSAGENLAHQFIVPDVKNETPFIVVDIHEIDANYEYPSFIFSVSNTSQSIEFADEIAKDLDIADYNFTEGTSPEIVTEPIANEGFDTLLYETSINIKFEEKKEIANKLVHSIDNLNS